MLPGINSHNSTCADFVTCLIKYSPLFYFLFSVTGLPFPPLGETSRLLFIKTAFSFLNMAPSLNSISAARGLLLTILYIHPEIQFNIAGTISPSLNSGQGYGDIIKFDDIKFGQTR